MNLYSLVWFLLILNYLNCSSKSEQNNAITNHIKNIDHSKKEVVVFVYHRFGNPKYPSTNISLVNFENQLKYLKTNDYKLLTFGQAVDYINNPQTPYFQKVACITIDDGYSTFKSNGIPLLNKYGYKATLFINSESVGGGSFLSWAELKEIHEMGIEIGNHSHSHAYFLNKPKSQRIEFFKEDLQRCQEEIEKHLGFYPDVFAYPYGEFDPEMKATLKGLGFKAAAAQNSGVMHSYDDYAIPRFPMAGPYVKLEGFKEKAKMKALRVASKSQESFHLTGQNPPSLVVEFDSTGVDLSRHNCFTSGTCETTLSGSTITIEAKNKLDNRRTLYTITAPAKKGKSWYWFSHLWIKPEVKE